MDLTVKPKLISSSNINGKRTKYSKSDSRLFVIGNDTE